jgi:hypothetical protein
MVHEASADAYDSTWRLTADWYLFDGSAADHANSGTNAHDSLRFRWMMQEAPNRVMRLHLNGATANVSKTVMTGVRLHCAGPTPTGEGYASFTSYEGSVASGGAKPPPKLIVEYETPDTARSAGNLSAGVVPARTTWGIYNQPGGPSTYKTLVGKKPAVYQQFSRWIDPDPVWQTFNPYGFFDEIRAEGGVPMWSWEPTDGTAPDRHNVAAYSLQNIAAGNFDAYIDDWAADCAAWGDPIILKFAWEMNHGGFNWCPPKHSSTPADYIAMWQHVHGRFQAQGATNAKWFFCFNVDFTGAPVRARQCYPGDAYVDYIGFDSYNWGNDALGHSWAGWDIIGGEPYDEAQAIAPTKRIIVGEGGCSQSNAPGGESKEKWRRDLYGTYARSRTPNIICYTWFSEDYGVFGEPDWRVNPSANALDAFKEMASHRDFQGSIVGGLPL